MLKKGKHLKKKKSCIKEILQISCYMLAFLMFLNNKRVDILICFITYLDYKFIKK